jgi:hypothetical protein|tara:strand:- start:385 stop:1089 length:705 start_codon:yes stop_codon:yes gene_type:complete
MNNEKFKSTIGFTDLLFNILVGFAFLFIIAFLLIKPEAKKEDFNRRAEFVVVLEWDNDANGDIDLYVEDPTGKQVSFRYHNHNYMHLDKDDLGSMNDTVVNADGSISTVKINREVVTIRGIIEGEYIINAHYYSLRSYDKINPKKPVVTVRVELHKANPYSIMWVGEKEFNHRGQEETFLRFRLDKDGRILPPFTFEQKKFVTPLQAMGNYQGSGVEAYENQNTPNTPAGATGR